MRTPGLASGSRRLTRSMAQRKAASVFPLPVGAIRRAFRPEARTGQPAGCTLVGAGCAASNQERTAARKDSIGRKLPRTRERSLVHRAALMYKPRMYLRSFLALVLVLVAIEAQAKQAREADVIVVGAGIAGLSVALEAARGGASVLVVDLWSIFGGHAVLSHGGLAIVGPPVEEAQGVGDTPEIGARDFLEWGEDANEPWVRYYAANSREQIYDWLTSMGVQFSGALRIPGNSVARFHEPVGRGLGLVSPIYRHAVRHPNIRFLWNFKVDGLVVEEGRVSGIEGVHQRSSEPETLVSDFVVLATGGFQSNLDMVRSFWPKGVPFPERLLAGSGLNSLGFGHVVAEKSGAVLDRMGHPWK